jgi:catechol 2,3-dioxygenase-like lactoylglutathione lyase family enzyme
MLRDADLVGFVPVADLDRARPFYVGVLGLDVLEETPFACVVDAHGTRLRLTPSPEHRPSGSTVIGWAVSDIDATVTDLTGRGVVFERFDPLDHDDNGVWASPSGDRVAWFTDPDGNVLSLTQYASGRVAGQRNG